MNLNHIEFFRELLVEFVDSCCLARSIATDDSDQHSAIGHAFSGLFGDVDDTRMGVPRVARISGTDPQSAADVHKHLNLLWSCWPT